MPNAMNGRQYIVMLNLKNASEGMISENELYDKHLPPEAKQELERLFSSETEARGQNFSKFLFSKNVEDLI